MVWSVVQSASSPSSGSATTKAVTFTTANLTAGTKIIAIVSASRFSGTGTISGVADGSSNALTLIGRVTIANAVDVSAWAMDTPAGDVGTKPTITATVSGAGETSILVQEVSGLATGNTTAAMIDGTGGSRSGTGGSSTGSPTYTSGAASEYMVSVYGDDGGPETWTAPGALTADANSVNSSSQANIAIAYGNSTNGTEAGSWAITGSTADWGMLLVAFKLAGGGASYSVDVTQTFTLTSSDAMSGGSAGSARPVLGVMVDWNNDGSFGDTGGDITRRVLLSRSALTIAYGRDTARALSPVSAGTAAFQVNNVSGDYYPDNLASPLAGNLVPGRPVLITGQQDATVHNMYRGFLDDYTPLPNSADRSVQFSCLDALARFQGVTLSTALYQGLRTGSAIAAILDALSWPALARDLDLGATYYRWWWEEGTDALSALLNILGDEGPPAICYVDGNGKFVFRDRHHRLQRAASKTAQATFTNGTAAEGTTTATYSMPSAYDAGWKNIINTVIFSSDQRDPQQQSVVWQQGSTGIALSGAGTVINQVSSSSLIQIIPAGGTVMITAQSSGDPFVSAVTPVAGTDYTQLTGTTTVSLSRTSGQSVVITLTDSGGGSSIQGLQLRAVPVTVTNTIQTGVSDSASQNAYGVRGTGGTGPDQSAGLPGITADCPPGDALAVAQVIVSNYAQRRPIVTLPFYNVSAFRLTQMLIRALSDRVTVTDSVTGMSADCFIERIEFTWSAGGRVLEALFYCEKAPTWPVVPFIFDDVTYGRFNTGGGFGI